jgi:hypothetical protein
MVAILVYVILIVLIGVWARRLNRGGADWAVFALLFSPLVAAIVLLAIGSKGPARLSCPSKIWRAREEWRNRYVSVMRQNRARRIEASGWEREHDRQWL